MDPTIEENFFIEEPERLENKFFSNEHQKKFHKEFKEKSQLLIHTNPKKPHLRQQYQQYQQLLQQQISQQQLSQKQLSQQQLSSQQSLPKTYSRQSSLSGANLPKSYIARLDILCEATFNTDDISFAKQAVDTLVSASKSGCCFLERYIVLLMNFCIKKYSISDSMNIKVDALLDKILIVDFDRQQLTENLRRPGSKLTSIEHVIRLIRRIQDMLGFEDEIAVGWLHVLLDAYFIELATSDEALNLIDQISAHVDFQCALVGETETTKSLLRSIIEQIDNSIAKTSTDNSLRHTRPYYSIHHIEL